MIFIWNRKEVYSGFSMDEYYIYVNKNNYDDAVFAINNYNK